MWCQKTLLNISKGPIFLLSVHSLPGSGSDKILGTHKRYIFSGSFLYIGRFIIAIQNGPSWVLPISDFFKLLFSKLRNEEKYAKFPLFTVK